MEFSSDCGPDGGKTIMVVCLQFCLVVSTRGEKDFSASISE
jgi:hypothetical protein